jgi:hypothetical protein
LRERNAASLAASGDAAANASYLMGDTGLLLGPARPGAGTRNRRPARSADRIEHRHPARELMWGSRGTMLAALFHARANRPRARFAELYRDTAHRLREQLAWFAEYECNCWTQDLYGMRSTYLGAVHGFVATASVLLRGPRAARRRISRPGSDRREHGAQDRDARRGRRELAPDACSVARHAEADAVLPRRARLRDRTRPHAGWHDRRSASCRGRSDLVSRTAAQRVPTCAMGRAATATRSWRCSRARAIHAGSTGPRRVRDARHRQTEAEAREVGRMRYSLWTGDLGFAVYLLDCVHGPAGFPTLDVLFTKAPPPGSP